MNKVQYKKLFMSLDKAEQTSLAYTIMDIVSSFCDKIPESLSHSSVLKLQTKRARIVAAYLIKENTVLSYHEIQKLFTTGKLINAQYAYDRIRVLMLCEDGLKNDISKLQSKITKVVVDMINDKREQQGREKVIYIDLESFVSFRFDGNKFLLAINFGDNESLDLVKSISQPLEMREHKNTGLNLLEDNSNHGKQESDND